MQFESKKHFLTILSTASQIFSQPVCMIGEVWEEYSCSHLCDDEFLQFDICYSFDYGRYRDTTVRCLRITSLSHINGGNGYTMLQRELRRRGWRNTWQHINRPRYPKRKCISYPATTVIDLVDP